MQNQIKTIEDINLALEKLKHIDKDLTPIMKAAGPIPLRRIAPGYEGLAHIVTSQLISRAAANTIWQRLKHGLGDINAQTIIDKDKEELKAFGLSGAKAQTLIAIAQREKEGLIDLYNLAQLSTDKAMDELTKIKGIGPWTAEIYLMFCAGHPDIFPSGDVALRNAVGHAFKDGARPSDKELRLYAQKWQPWRSVAARLFWAYYSNHMQQDKNPV